MSLRKAINGKCRECAYDDQAPGTWKQQVTLCAVKSCALWPVRPKTDSLPPDSVLSSYGVESAQFQALLDNNKEAA